MQGIPPLEALEKVYAHWHPQPRVETIPVDEAIGRVLVEDQHALVNVPVYRSSCMDGVGVHSADFADGMPDTSNWVLGKEYCRADTGDDFDDAFDAVIAIEHVDLSAGYPVFDIDEVPLPGDGVNRRGSTLAKDTLLVKAGTMLQVDSVALLIMGGIAEVPVKVRPKVAFFPTGTELVPVGQTPQRGQVVDCNSVIARHMLTEFGADVQMHPILRDDAEAMSVAVDAAIDACDIVILNGGSSKGSEDLGPTVISREAEQLFHWVQAGPGRPVCAAIVRDTLLLVIPGPPFGCINVLEYFACSVIDYWFGIQTHRHVVRARLAADVQTPPFMMIVPMEVSRAEDGALTAMPRPFRGSTPLAMAAGGYIHSPVGTSRIPKGTEVDVSMYGTRLVGLVDHAYMRTDAPGSAD